MFYLGSLLCVLTLSQTSPGFYVSALQDFWKHCGKRRNCLYKQFLLFPQCFQKASFLDAPKGVIVWEWVHLVTLTFLWKKSLLEWTQQRKQTCIRFFKHLGNSFNLCIEISLVDVTFFLHLWRLQRFIPRNLPNDKILDQSNLKDLSFQTTN